MKKKKKPEVQICDLLAIMECIEEFKNPSKITVDILSHITHFLQPRESKSEDYGRGRKIIKHCLEYISSEVIITKGDYFFYEIKSPILLTNSQRGYEGDSDEKCMNALQDQWVDLNTVGGLSEALQRVAVVCHYFDYLCTQKSKVFNRSVTIGYFKMGKQELLSMNVLKPDSGRPVFFAKEILDFEKKKVAGSYFLSKNKPVAVEYKRTPGLETRYIPLISTLPLVPNFDS